MDADMTAEVAQRLVEFVDRMDDLVGVSDEHGRVVYLNQTARKYLGVGDTAELTTADLFAPEAFASYYDEVRPALLHSGTWTGELAIRTGAGNTLPMLFSVVAGVRPGGEITGLVAHGRPVPVVGPQLGTRGDAANIVEREVLLDRIAEALDRGAESCAVVYVEVRDMAALADHGGLLADGAIRTVGRRLTSTVRASDFVARVDRNAFFILFVDTRDAGQAMRLVKSVEDAFEREPIWSVAGEIPVRLRCGLALAHAGDDADAVLGRAQLASATSAPVTRSTVKHDDLTILAACQALRPAVMQGEVLTFIRSVVDRRRLVVGYDACPHWEHAGFRSYELDTLETIADRAGVSTAIALRALREAAAFLMTSPANAPNPISIALPEPMLRDAYVEQYIWEVTDATGIAPSQIALLVDPIVASPATLRSLRETGARLVARNVDHDGDVLALVTDHHFVELRLRESMVAQIDTEPAIRTAIYGVTTRAHDVGARVTAPGVTSGAQCDALLDAGVDFMSGDLFGPPISAESVT